MPHAEFGKKIELRDSPRSVEAKETIGKKIANAPGYLKVGAGVGAVALLFVGMPAIIPVGLGAVGLTVYHRTRKPSKYSSCMTPERIKVYEQAINTLKDSRKLRVLAEEFDKQGCKKEAEHLRKRALLADMPKEDRKGLRVAYRKAMGSKNPDGIAKVAAKFDSIGADGAAQHLRIREKSLRELAAS